MTKRRLHILITLIGILLTFSAGAADTLSVYPRVFPRAMGMGGASVSTGPSFESVFYNPASAADFQKLSFTLPGIAVNIDNSYFSLTKDLVENKDQFNQNDTGISEEQLAATQNLMKDFDAQWFGLSTDIADAALLFRGFGVLFRQRFAVDFQANRGLLFPFMLAQYGQEREIALVFGREFSKWFQFGLSLKLLTQQKKTVSLASNSIGKIDSSFWSLEGTPVKKGIGVDAGAIINIPGHRRVGFAAKDLGMELENRDRPDLSIGYSRDIRENFINDYRFLGEIVTALEMNDIIGPQPTLAKVKAGVEMGFNFLPRNWLTLRFRTGLNGGYVSFGTGLQVLRFVELDYVTYAEEQGEYLGQNPRRRHLIYGKIHINFNRTRREKPRKEADESPDSEAEYPPEHENGGGVTPTDQPVPIQ